jgi:hypothetical protein
MTWPRRSTRTRDSGYGYGTQIKSPMLTGLMGDGDGDGWMHSSSPECCGEDVRPGMAARATKRRLGSSAGGVQRTSKNAALCRDCFWRQCRLLFLDADGVDVDVMIGNLRLALEISQDHV